MATSKREVDVFTKFPGDAVYRLDMGGDARAPYCTVTAGS
jgi:hypothetical protein